MEIQVKDVAALVEEVLSAMAEPPSPPSPAPRVEASAATPPAPIDSRLEAVREEGRMRARMAERARCREVAALAERMGAPREVLILAIAGGDNIEEAEGRFRRYAAVHGVRPGPSDRAVYDGRRETYEASPALQAEFAKWGGFETFRAYSESLHRGSAR